MTREDGEALHEELRDTRTIQAPSSRHTDETHHSRSLQEREYPLSELSMARCGSPEHEAIHRRCMKGPCLRQKAEEGEEAEHALLRLPISTARFHFAAWTAGATFQSHADLMPASRMRLPTLQALMIQRAAKSAWHVVSPVGSGWLTVQER